MRNTTSSRLGEAGCSGGGDGGGGGAIQTSVLAFFPYRWVRSARASALGYELCKAPVFCFSSSALSLSLAAPQKSLRRRRSRAARHSLASTSGLSCRNLPRPIAMSSWSCIVSPPSTGKAWPAGPHAVVKHRQ